MPVSDRTGGRLCYTHHTGSACHPHLGKCNLLVMSATALLNPRSRSCCSTGGQCESTERCKVPSDSRDPSFLVPPLQWKPAAFKKSQTKEYKVPCPAKISFEAKVETCQIGSTQAKSQAKYREEKFAAKMPESLARSYKCSYFYFSLNLVNLHTTFFLLKVASLHRISACSRTSLSVLLTDTGKWGDSPEPAISFAEEEKRKHRELASMSLSLTFQFLNSVKL